MKEKGQSCDAIWEESWKMKKVKKWFAAAICPDMQYRPLICTCSNEALNRVLP